MVFSVEAFNDIRFGWLFQATSYGIYGNLLAGAMVAGLGLLPASGVTYLFASLALTHVLALVLYFGIEVPLNVQIRERIRAMVRPA